MQDADHQTKYVKNDEIAFNPSLTYKPSDDTSLTLLGNFQKNHSGSGTAFLPHQGTIFPAPYGPIPWDTFLSEPGWDKYDTTQNSATAFIDHKFNKEWALKATTRYLEGTSEYYTIYGKFPPKINSDGRTINLYASASEANMSVLASDVRINGDFTTGFVSHKLATGIDYQNSKSDSKTYNSGVTPIGTIDLYNPVYGNNIPNVVFVDQPYSKADQKGIYLNDHLTFFDHLILSLGARLDTVSRKTQGRIAQEDNAVTKNAGLMYKFDNGFSPYISYAESFVPIIGMNFYGQTYKPKEGVQYEAGVKYQPVGTKSLLTASVFEITEQNRTTTDPLHPTFFVQTGEVQIKGLELEAAYNWKDFDILANYTRLKTEVTKSNTADLGRNFASVPNNMFNFWATWKPKQYLQGFRTGAGIRYIGKRWDGSDKIMIKPYTLGDAMIGYEFTQQGINIALNIHNITDEKYISTCLSRGDCFLGERRKAMLSLTKKF